jgi:hypothetical protein
MGISRRRRFFHQIKAILASLRVSFAKLRAGTCVSYASNLGEFRLISRLVFGPPDHISQLVGPKCCFPYPTVALKLYSTASVYGNIIVDVFGNPGAGWKSAPPRRSVALLPVVTGGERGRRNMLACGTSPASCTAPISIL